MKTIKTSELTGIALDWSAAKADDNLHPKGDVRLLDGKVFTIEAGDYERSDRWQRYSPSTVWAQAGPILEREITKVFRNVGGTWSAMILKDVPIPPEDRGTSLALTQRAQWNGAGPTALIAAMRCFCCSRLGSEIEVPDELL